LALIGLIVAIASSSVQGKELPDLVNNFMLAINANNLTPQLTAALFGLSAAILLVSKSVLSYYFGLRNFAFLTRREVVISEKLSKKIFSTQITDLQKYTTPEYQHALTIGSSSVMVGVLGQSLSLITELMLQLVLLLTLIFYRLYMFNIAEFIYYRFLYD
jgi:hypothetical protein